MLKKKLFKFMNYYYFIKNYYIYHILFLYTFFLRITYTYAEITISHFFTFLLNKYENTESQKEEENFFYYFTHFFNFSNKNDDKFLNTKLFLVVYLPVCLKCFYTLFFDYIAYYVYIRYYFKRINNNYRKIYYSSVSYENGKEQIGESFFFKKDRVGLMHRISKRKKNSYDVCAKRLSDMSLYECRRYMLRKKKAFSLWQRKQNLKTKRKKRKNSTVKRVTCKEDTKKKQPRIKFITCRNSFIKNKLLNNDQRDAQGNKLFHNVFKNRKNIFFRRKQRKRNDAYEGGLSSGSSTEQGADRKKDKCIFNKLYMSMQKGYNFVGSSQGGRNISDETTGISRTTSIYRISPNGRDEHMNDHVHYDTSSVEANAFCGPNSWVGSANEENLHLLKFTLDKIGDTQNDITPNHFQNSNGDYFPLNESNPIGPNIESGNYEEIRFENLSGNGVCISKAHHSSGGGDMENAKKNQQSEEGERPQGGDEQVVMALSNGDIKGDGGDTPNYEANKTKKSYRTLRGSLKMDYLFKDSYELGENNKMESTENNDYYYYNKFKNFNYGKKDNLYSVRELINNKINAEYYHLKLNILILSCIIIQIFNSCILILISNNFIRKKENLFFFCFLYSLLESVTDVISENIFFLCGKFTNIYKKEFSINAIYVIQVISKMILSLSTIFIYFVYHIFVILYEHVNIMIINTFIKTLSIFVLSFIFLKNKDNFFNYQNDATFAGMNFEKKTRVATGEAPTCEESDSVKIDMKGMELRKKNGADTVRNASSEEVQNGCGVKKDPSEVRNSDDPPNLRSNFNQEIFSNYLYNNKYYGDYFNFSKNNYYGERLLTDNIVSKGSSKEGDKCVNPFSVKLKYFTEFLNVFKLLSRINCYIFKKDEMKYSHSYTLLTVQDAKGDEKNVDPFSRNKIEYKIKIPIWGDLKKLFNTSNNSCCYSGVQDGGITKYNSLIEQEMEYLRKKKKKKLQSGGQYTGHLYNIENTNSLSSLRSLNSVNSVKRAKKRNIIVSYPIKLLLSNLNFSNIFYICLLLIIPTFERIFLNYKIKNIKLDLHGYCYLNFVNYLTDLMGLYLYISYFNEESYSSSIFLSSLINIFLMSFRFFSLHNRFSHIWLLFLETILKSLHKTFFYMPIYILVTKVYIKNIHNLMCSFYSSILDASSFASYYFEYVILSYYSIEDSRNIFILVYIIFLVLNLSSLVVISKLKKT
ncbi:conserved Plasmodium protein, unknown function [Plasmodium knowlesi strain H]|uniref:Uncharacterized protein n=3 Tax=Plasmodium knowlesi TaxID=5850 RepID=A0A5K1U3T2_PLAKH|nr:conserved Plasmodium protein, unknown function [Plasmodium knowlesi strain H]OTN67050.1 Uncharacterized protein PKNOH_S07440000 [Plasmodium knowlesi]CAA9988533.1 conserved Plasmodium protein, unknown function [Plasmodium knowlesi strain H]SBO21309.1 conserved Plasmodium protein, unknown function [Plasmodium knowlesi strain H]SBO21766.1 conserved Plasmodium protein, unknown function [Plasmodium knowlesi strain H]VVS78007.1 conserved Plasmodium protein, unknown function [Plasmodium knowlesi s|eukprot:XP_002259507.1 hypothetical protein, conserved in Plasmodium species [Plasmodium knowlesi strain H]